jgi:hypothetical protein
MRSPNGWTARSRKNLKPGFSQFDQAKAAIAKAIEAYRRSRWFRDNQLRPHASCDYLTPAQAHQKEGSLKKRWRKPERKVPVNEIQGTEIPNRILSLWPVKHFQEATVSIPGAFR